MRSNKAAEKHRRRERERYRTNAAYRSRQLAKKKQRRLTDPTYREWKNNYSRAHWRKERYGVTEEMFEAMLLRAGSACEICRTSFTEKLRPQIDHCHTTGVVRGLLCMPCNTSLAMVDKAGLRAVEQYLSRDNS